MEFDILRRVTAKILGADPNEITMDMTFLSDLGADSLDVCQIIMGVEDELDITIPTDRLDGITTVGEALNLIQSVNHKKP